LLSFVVFLIGFTGIHKTARIAKWFVWILIGLLAFYTVSILTTPGVRFNIPITDQFSINSLLLSGSIWFFAFTGYSRLATFGEEIKNPEKIIPTAIFTGLGITVLCYLIISWVTLSIVDPEIVMNSKTPLLIAMDLSAMSEFSFLIIFGSSIAMTSVFLALMPGISRIYVAMARDGILPRALSTIHKKFNSAYLSEVLVLITVIIGIYQLNVIDSIKLSSFFILIYYSITNLSVIRLEKEQRIYTVVIAYYGLVLCIIFACSLLLL